MIFPAVYPTKKWIASYIEDKYYMIVTISLHLLFAQIITENCTWIWYFIKSLIIDRENEKIFPDSLLQSIFVLLIVAYFIHSLVPMMIIIGPSKTGNRLSGAIQSKIEAVR